jgi:hypothetical protein
MGGGLHVFEDEENLAGPNHPVFLAGDALESCGVLFQSPPALQKPGILLAERLDGSREIARLASNAQRVHEPLVANQRVDNEHHRYEEQEVVDGGPPPSRRRRSRDALAAQRSGPRFSLKGPSWRHGNFGSWRHRPGAVLFRILFVPNGPRV